MGIPGRGKSHKLLSGSLQETNMSVLIASLRYVRELRQWVYWDGRRWCADPRKLRVKRRIIDAGAQRLSEVNRAVRAAQNDPAVSVELGEFDRHRELFNCANGTLDTRSGELRPHAREDMLTPLCPTAFNPRAVCPKWEQFIGEVAGGAADKLQRLFSSCLRGSDGDRVCPVFYGAPYDDMHAVFHTLAHALGPDYAGFARELFKGCVSRSALWRLQGTPGVLSCAVASLPFGNGLVFGLFYGKAQPRLLLGPRLFSVPLSPSVGTCLRPQISPTALPSRNPGAQISPTALPRFFFGAIASRFSRHLVGRKGEGR
jgi:hypothetical protein